VRQRRRLAVAGKDDAGEAERAADGRQPRWRLTEERPPEQDRDHRDQVGERRQAAGARPAKEAAAVSELLVQGWAVSPGERFRIRSAPGIRITTTDLRPDEAERLADALAALGRPPASTYAG
jgi:hypothetical protein